MDSANLDDPRGGVRFTRRTQATKVGVVDRLAVRGGAGAMRG
jgi:hypothetical protein